MQALYERIYQEMAQRGIVSLEDREVLIYGLDMFLYTLGSLSALFILGTILGHGSPSAVIILVAVSFQGFAGGFHAKTHLRCFITMVCGLLSALALYVIVPLEVVVVAAIILSPVIWIYAPTPHENAPLTPKEWKRMRFLSRVLLFVCLASLGLLIPFSAPIAKAVALGMICAAVSIGVARKRIKI